MYKCYQGTDATIVEVNPLILTTKDEIIVLKKRVEQIYNIDIKTLEKKLIDLGVPYTPGRGYEPKN